LKRRSVTIGGKRFAVRVVSDVRAHLREIAPEEPHERQILAGYCDVEDGLIVVARDRSQKAMASTFLHELLHAAGLGADQERLVYRLERLLFPVLWNQGWRP